MRLPEENNNEYLKFDAVQIDELPRTKTFFLFFRLQPYQQIRIVKASYISKEPSILSQTHRRYENFHSED